MTQFTSLLTAPSRRIAALVVFTNLFVLVLVGVSLDTSYRQYRERAEIASRNTNRLVSQSIAGEIDRIDMGLQAVGDEFARQQAGGVIDKRLLDAFLARQQTRLPMVDSLRIADAEGRVVHGTGITSQTAVTNADRDYFIALRDTPGLGLAISKPVVSRISGNWVLVFARRLSERPGGPFAGIVYAPVTIEWFERKFRGLEVGPQGAVVMRGDASRDFDLLARFPHAGFVGQTAVSDTFRATITAHPAGGTYVAEAVADSIRRTFSFQPVGDYPLITLVGLATEDYLGGWWRDFAKLMGLAMVFALTTTVGGLAMLRASRALEQRTEELARSNADLERFAYVASHDLQTPLRTIASFTQLLERRYRDRLDADADEYINFIVAGAKRMSSLIIDLRDFARANDPGKVARPVAARHALDTALANLGEAIEAKGASITVGELPTVLAEESQLVLVFQNLIENAVKYGSRDRPLEIAISAERHSPSHWRLDVRDNGIGIEERYFDKIFLMFQRLDPAADAEGTGIGLAICQRLVLRMGGRIWVRSTAGEGSTFSFTVPAAD